MTRAKEALKVEKYRKILFNSKLYNCDQLWSYFVCNTLVLSMDGYRPIQHIKHEIFI